jgi:hypothetical protein
MSPTDPDHGLPRPGRHPRSWVTRANDAFDAPGANIEMAQKLRHKGLRRRAQLHGLELRHSDYGYALIDSARMRVDGRSDMTLDEVAAHLDVAFGSS